MATLKIVAKKNQKADGTYPLVIRVTKDRITNFIHTGHFVKLEDWDAKAQHVLRSHPNHARFNNLLRKKLTEADDKLLEMESSKTDVSTKGIKQGIVATKEGTFLKQAGIYLEQLKKQGKFNRHSADEPRIKRFKEFNNGDSNFSEINVQVLKKFKTWLKATRQVSDRTIVNHLIVIRTIFNQAISEGRADQKYYPFGKGKIVIKFPDTLKIGLTPEEILNLEKIELISLENHARNLWLLSFYFAGMRASDVLRLKWTDFQDGRLYYKMGKNAKGGTLKVPQKALAILQQYEDRKRLHEFVFHDLDSFEKSGSDFDMQRRIKTRIKSAKEQLKSIALKLTIQKPLTMHIPRHSFGNISGDKIPIQMLQKLYRHTSITTTIGYQANFIHKDADDALDTVLDFN